MQTTPRSQRLIKDFANVWPLKCLKVVLRSGVCVGSKTMRIKHTPQLPRARVKLVRVEPDAKGFGAPSGDLLMTGALCKLQSQDPRPTWQTSDRVGAGPADRHRDVPSPFCFAISPVFPSDLAKLRERARRMSGIG